MSDNLPLVAITLGDVTGIGPEVLLRGWHTAGVLAHARPLVIGQSAVVTNWAERLGIDVSVVPVANPEDARASVGVVPCLDAGDPELAEIAPGSPDARAGRAASDFLQRAIDLALERRIDAITTLPLHKEALRAAGIEAPGHTELLAARCGMAQYAMMLYVAPPRAAGPAGLGIIHATLHMRLRDVFEALTVDRVRAAIELADAGLRPFTAGRRPRVWVAGLNPHAGEHGLFGDEEQAIIEPAIERARRLGFEVEGPIAADTLFRRAFEGACDAVVAMYHDQGHVAVKSLAFHHAVNVTLGLPIIRTSVAHGTAHDIAGRGQANPTSLIEAVRVAGMIAKWQRMERPAPAADEGLA